MPTYNGTTGDDSYWGGPTSDQIYGHDGDDYLLGNGGADDIFGGNGNDNLHGGDGNDTIDGGEGDDGLQGDDGIDTLRGMGGNDRLLLNPTGTSIAGESLDGGDGVDTLQFDGLFLSTSITFSIANPSVAQNLAGATVVNVEQLSFRSGSGNDDITGGALGDYINGYEGDDRINGGGGNDSLDGDGGTDTIYGGGGNDEIRGGSGGMDDLLYGGGGDDTFHLNEDALIDGGAGVDQLRIENYYSVGVTVDISDPNVKSMVLGTRVIRVERLWFSAGTGDDRITGGVGDDVLIGNDGHDILIGGSGTDEIFGGDGNDQLKGGTGDDTLEGGTGADVYVVNSIGDKVTEYSGAGFDTVRASISWTLGTHSESLQLIGTASINGTGNARANEIRGNSGANILKGAAGDDKLHGGTGDDKLYGGGGVDTLTGAAGSDHFYFDTALNGVNVDRITDFSAAADSIYLDLSVFSGISAEGTLAKGAFRLGTAATDASDRVIYDSATGNIYYDADGTGSGAQVLFAQVTPGTTLSNADFIAFAAGTSSVARSVDSTSISDRQVSGEFSEPARMLEQEHWAHVQHARAPLDWNNFDYFSA